MDTVITTDDVKQNVARNLKRAIDDRGWSVSDFIQKTGIPKNTTYRILRAENAPTLTHLTAIRDTMGISIDWLISENSEF